LDKAGPRNGGLQAILSQLKKLKIVLRGLYLHRHQVHGDMQEIQKQSDDGSDPTNDDRESKTLQKEICLTVKVSQNDHHSQLHF
jgi:hypothetical protein